MDNRKLLSLALSVPFVLAGCSSYMAGAGKSGNGADASGAGAYDKVNGVDVSSQDLMQEKTFYFDFDKSVVKPHAMPALMAHAKYLASHPEAHIRLEGHTDERGSREYNIGLGERRAKAVEDVLVANGADKKQIALVSYGREKPAVQGHDESAWQYNRRAILAYEAS